jgi:aminopeptidase N
MNAYGNEYKYQQIGGKDVDGLMLHELGHEWWGNKVTGIDFSDMWIQEGICVFGDAMYTREYGGEEAYLKRMQRTARATRNVLPIKMGDNLGSDTTYHSDIYGKGAFFMHTLRYVIGDEIFFPALKKLATHPDYTYDSLISTDDVETFFSKEAGQNLKPLFDFYLRTIQKLEVQVKQVNETVYQLELLNYDATLPMDIVTNQGPKRMMINKDGIEITSTTPPVIDPDVYYLKRVIQEW